MRLIRARAGYRPIIRVSKPQTVFLKGKGLTAIFILDGKRFILDGLDLIVDVPDLPLDRTALFLCKGADLTLRNCTITVLNPAGRPFTLFRTAPPEDPSGRASRIRLDRTFMRGMPRSAFDLSGSPAEVAIARSALILGAGPLIACQPAGTTGTRRIHLFRSLLACGGPILEIPSSAATARPDSVSVRALGTTFARIEGASRIKPDRLAFEETRARRASLLARPGQHLLRMGAWLASGEARTVEVADLAAARGLALDRSRKHRVGDRLAGLARAGTRRPGRSGGPCPRASGDAGPGGLALPVSEGEDRRFLRPADDPRQGGGPGTPRARVGADLRRRGEPLEGRPRPLPPRADGGPGRSGPSPGHGHRDSRMFSDPDARRDLAGDPGRAVAIRPRARPWCGRPSGRRRARR